MVPRWPLMAGPFLLGAQPREVVAQEYRIPQKFSFMTVNRHRALKVPLWWAHPIVTLLGKYWSTLALWWYRHTETTLLLVKLLCTRTVP